MAFKIIVTRGKTVLIRHILLALPMHMISILQPPKDVIVQIKKIIAKFSGALHMEQIGIMGKLVLPIRKWRILHDICNTFSAKARWKLRTWDTLWRDFMLVKYGNRVHPLVKNPGKDSAHS